MSLDIYEGHQTETECLQVLLSALKGKSTLDVCKILVANMYEESSEVENDSPDEFDRAEDLRLLTPDFSRPVPNDLLEPTTLLDVIRAAEHKAHQKGDEDREHACGVLRIYLRSGSIHEIADCLIESTENAEEYVS